MHLKRAQDDDDRRRRFGLRPIVIVLIVLQVALPSTLLVVRHLDPSIGQLPFGWQMHTTCWGSDNPKCG